MVKSDVNSSRAQRKRAYHSPARAAAALETRRRIRDAAEALFLRDGYAPTTMTAVARAAGVAEKTVYLVFPTKAALLDEVIVAAIRDETSEQPPREQLRRALELQPDQLLTRFAELNGDLMRRAARLIALGESAATVDPHLAAFRDRGHASMRDDVGKIVGALAAHNALAEGVAVDEAADTIYALANDSVYLRLIDGCGWPPERYAPWLSRVLTGALIAV